jgi:hypothetical protein
MVQPEDALINDFIPSSSTTKSISPSSPLARDVNKIEKLIEGIKNILDETSLGLACHIKIVDQGSLIMADLGELYRENFIKFRDTAKCKAQKKGSARFRSLVHFL